MVDSKGAHYNPEVAAVGEVLERRLVPRKMQRRQEHFVRVPWTWIDRLKGADGQTYRVALYLLYMDWKGDGSPVKLTSGALAVDGVPRETKRRALADLERRGLVTVERLPRKSPIVRLCKISAGD
jgi:hypothetical protein